MKENVEAYKNAKVDEIMGSIKNRVLHVFNCGYEAGFKDGKIVYAEMLTKLVGEKLEVPEAGHWVNITDRDLHDFRSGNRLTVECSCCKSQFSFWTNYCPTCGVKMEKQE